MFYHFMKQCGQFDLASTLITAAVEITKQMIDSNGKAGKNTGAFESLVPKQSILKKISKYLNQQDFLKTNKRNF